MRLNSKSENLIWSAVIFGCILAVGSVSAATDIRYEHYVYAVGSDGIPIMDEDILVGQTHLLAEYTKTGAADAGNYGHVRYGADISTGRVQFYAYSVGGVSEFYPSQCTATARVENISFYDDLFFTVPAGFYPDGVTVSLSGHLKGTVWSEVGAGARMNCYVSFGAQTFSTPIHEVGVDEEGSIILDEGFTLDITLVAPGATLNQVTEYSKFVRAGLYNGRIWSVFYNTGQGYVTGAAEGNFLGGDNGLQITDLDVPPGVQWHSDSGVFLSYPAPVDQDLAVVSPRVLEPNYPNPFNPVTVLPFNLGQAGPVDLQVYSLDGGLVRNLIQGEFFAEGRHEIPWNGRDKVGRLAPAGVYLYRINSPAGIESRRMILVK